MWTPATLALMVVSDTALAPPVHLNVGGIQIDRHRLLQPSPPHHRDPLQHSFGNLRHPSLHTDPLWIGDPACQSRGGSRTQSRHGRDGLTRRIRALPVQASEEVLTSQLSRRQTDQQFTGAEPTITLLDRPDRRVQRLDHTQPFHQFGDRGHPRHRRQARVRRADSHPRPTTT